MRIVALILTLFLTVTVKGQLVQHSFEGVDSLSKIEEKPIVVMLHTDWCQYCQLMKNTTLKDEKVIKRLNSDFYFISFNAEFKEAVLYQGHSFQFKSNGSGTGVHELAEMIGKVDGKLSYPTIAVLNSKNEILYQYAGAMDREQMKTLLKTLRN